MSPDQLAALFDLAYNSTGKHAEEVLESLVGLDLVVDLGATAPEQGYATYQLSERGSAFVQHVGALPLPEQVSVWRVPTTDGGIMQITAQRSTPVVAVPPEPEIPADPAVRRTMAANLIAAGWGRGEVAAKLKMTESEVDQAAGFT